MSAATQRTGTFRRLITLGNLGLFGAFLWFRFARCSLVLLFARLATAT